MDKKQNEQKFLEHYVFQGLKNLNNGFDSKCIYYFSKEDFEIVLNRVEFFKIGILGVEPWPDGSYRTTLLVNDSEYQADDPQWYRAAFKQLLDMGITSHFSASYFVPDQLLELFINNSEE